MGDLVTAKFFALTPGMPPQKKARNNRIKCPRCQKEMAWSSLNRHLSLTACGLFSGQGVTNDSALLAVQDTLDDDVEMLLLQKEVNLSDLEDSSDESMVLDAGPAVEGNIEPFMDNIAVLEPPVLWRTSQTFLFEKMPFRMKETGLRRSLSLLTSKNQWRGICRMKRHSMR